MQTNLPQPFSPAEIQSFIDDTKTEFNANKENLCPYIQDKMAREIAYWYEMLERSRRGEIRRDWSPA